MTISAVAPTAEDQELSGTDRQARFADEVIPYMSRLYPTALRLTRNHCDAEDLLQETFAKAYIKFHQFCPGTNLRAWLHRILVTTFYSGCRRRERRATEVLAAEIFDSAGPQDGLAQPPRSAETEALERLGDSRVMRALGTLPECFKVAVYLADVEGYRYAEVAELTGAPLGTVMSRIHRGRAMLRQNLRPRTPGDRVAGERAGARRAPGHGPSARPSAVGTAATPPDVLRMAA
ncbi:MAG TPA: sigma-70 family RNA polymerase sigma factor [Streptosporangiaceae bacterium]|nr:sigma-70 family RNA polymerase sigma factor [Streptosporangiaceae bacterium]